MTDQTLSYAFRGNDNTVTTKLPVTEKTANYSVDANDDIARELTFDTSLSDLTVSLPTASSAGNGFNVILRNDGIGVLTIDPDGSETIDGELTEDLQMNQVLWIRCDGLSWRSVAGVPTGGNTSIADGKNFLINGGFDIWQRGTSFTATGYTADRWRADEGAGAFTVSQQSFTLGQTDVPGGPEFFLEYDMTSGSASAPTLEQRVEGVRTFGGQTATLSFYAKVASGTLSVTPRLRQDFGTGGSPSADVDTDGADITITDSWQLFEITIDVPSISGKTLGSGGNDYLSVMLVLPTSSTFTLGIALVKLEAGDVATSFVPPSSGEELNRCLRYYWRDDVPTGVLRGYSRSSVAIMNNVGELHLPLSMRSNPTPAVFPAYNTGSGWIWNDSTSTNPPWTGAPTIVEFSSTSVGVRASCAPALNIGRSVQYYNNTGIDGYIELDAEL